MTAVDKIHVVLTITYEVERRSMKYKNSCQERSNFDFPSLQVSIFRFKIQPAHLKSF